VSDQGQHESLAQDSRDLADQLNRGPTIDGDSVGNHRVGLDPVRVCLESASVGRIGIESECVWIVSVARTVVPAAGARKAPIPPPVSIVVAPAMIPLPPSLPLVTLTGPLPVADPL